MSLSFYLIIPACDCCGRSAEAIFDINITHNLGAMADAAGLYNVLWRPDENGICKAVQAIPYLVDGLARLKREPEHFRQYDASNGWGTYEHFVPFVEKVLIACEQNPEASIEVSR